MLHVRSVTSMYDLSPVYVKYDMGIDKLLYERMVCHQYDWFVTGMYKKNWYRQSVIWTNDLSLVCIISHKYSYLSPVCIICQSFLIVISMYDLSKFFYL